MEKKQTSDGYLGFIHWALGGLIFPTLIMLIPVILLFAFVEFDADGNFVDPHMDYVTTIVIAVIGFAATWLGAKISATRLTKRYQLSNPLKILQLSTGIFVALSIIFVVLDVVMPDVSAQSPVFYMGASLVVGVADSVIFYVVSKKYLL